LTIGCILHGLDIIDLATVGVASRREGLVHAFEVVTFEKDPRASFNIKTRIADVLAILLARPLRV
jgi:hypothetical protein